MRFLGLTSDCVLDRMTDTGGPVRVRSWIGSVLGGAFGFGAVSVLVFAIWAGAGGWFFHHLGEAGTYLAWALIFIGGGGAVLGQLVIGPGGGRRFAGGFALAFLAYSVVWMGAWFGLRGQVGEWVGALGGTAVFGLLLCAMFRDWSAWPVVLFGLAAGNVAGYFLGGALHQQYGGNLGKVLWGLSYGLGFGAGIGHALHSVQAGLRERLSDATEARRRN